MKLEEFVNILNYTNNYWLVVTPIIFNILDFVTGFVKGIAVDGKPNSQIMRKGLLHKFLLILVLFSSLILDFAFFNYSFISKIVSVYIVLMEIASMYENLEKAGVPLDDLINIIKKGGEKIWSYLKKN